MTPLKHGIPVAGGRADDAVMKPPLVGVPAAGGAGVCRKRACEDGGPKKIK